QVSVQNPSAQVNVSTGSGSGSVNVPGVGRICFAGGCRRALLSAVVSSTDGSIGYNHRSRALQQQKGAVRAAGDILLQRKIEILEKIAARTSDQSGSDSQDESA
ncbi:hypothetical protein Agub_g7177, partial [Astrephomene gubernaculifera]